jgi:hypothetical protein
VNLVAGKVEAPKPLTTEHRRDWRVVVEVGLVFAVFFLQGASPVPEVNEPYYLGKAIHFWNPEWAAGDFFLTTADSHQTFYFTFGWLSLWLPPLVLAWVGRLLTWGLLAWAWQRLSFALVPRRWFSILTAALFVGLLERYHMAGEWVIGGVEAKGFAYVLVFLGLEALVRGRWNRMWLLLGAASAFHVLVGGWSVVAAGIGWLVLGSERPSLRSMLPALAGGFLLSLPGLVPALQLTWGVDAETVRQANILYVFERLYHHLDPVSLPTSFLYRFLGMVGLLVVLDWLSPADVPRRRLRWFTYGALAIAAAGMAIGFWVTDEALRAGLLRFYWFRLSDVVVPLAVALLTARGIAHLLATRPRLGKAALALATVAAGIHVGAYALIRPLPMVPRADVDRVAYQPWCEACAWIVESGQIPPNARFLTPILAQTFKWYTGRTEVANWKDVPQDARSLLAWRDRVQDICPGLLIDPAADDSSLADEAEEHLRQVAAKYQVDYILTSGWPPLSLDVVYENDAYVIYRMPKTKD